MEKVNLSITASSAAHNNAGIWLVNTVCGSHWTMYTRVYKNIYRLGTTTIFDTPNEVVHESMN